MSTIPLGCLGRPQISCLQTQQISCLQTQQISCLQTQQMSCLPTTDLFSPHTTGASALSTEHICCPLTRNGPKTKETGRNPLEMNPKAPNSLGGGGKGGRWSKRRKICSMFHEILVRGEGLGGRAGGSVLTWPPKAAEKNHQ